MHKLLVDFFGATPLLSWLPIIGAIWVIEKVFCARQNASIHRSLRVQILNLGTGFITCISMFVMAPLASIAIFALGNWFGLGLIDLRVFPHYDLASQVLSAIMLMFLEDFFFYFYHRASHAIPFLWDIHAVHHSDLDMDATTSLRRHWLETPLQEMLVTIPAMLLFRLTPVEMGIVAFGRSAFVFFAHMNLRLQMRRYSWLLTGPQLHRLHHSYLKEHWDSNYAQVFPIFDKLFGTYVAPKWNEFPPTGLASNERVETLRDVLFWPFRKWVGRVKSRAKTNIP